MLTDAQRAQLTCIPADLSDRDIARFYTLSPEDIAFIRQHRRNVNRLGVAVQLCVLRYPGRTLMTLPDVPVRVLRAIAQQLNIEPTAFVSYGERHSTCYEHLDAIKAHYGYRTLSWQGARAVMWAIFPQAQANTQPLPLVEAALQQLRDRRIIAPGITTVERPSGARSGWRHAALSGCSSAPCLTSSGSDWTRCWLSRPRRQASAAAASPSPGCASSPATPRATSC